MFRIRVISSLDVIGPIASSIQEIEKDYAILSNVPRLFNDLNMIKPALPSSPLLNAEQSLYNIIHRKLLSRA